MNRIWRWAVVILLLVGMGAQSRAGLFNRRRSVEVFGAGGSCPGGVCGVSGGFSGVQGFGAGVGYSAPMMSYSMPMASSSGAGGGCYSSSYNAQMSYSAPAPMTYGAGGGGCYSSSYAPQAYSVPVYSVPRYQAAPVPQAQAAPSPQTQAAPSLPSKMLPNQEYTPSKSSPRGAVARTPGIRRSIREIPEKRPSAIIRCDGGCCGGAGACVCGDTCGCGSSPGASEKKERTRLVGVDYSGMDRQDMSRLVDYDSVSATTKNVKTSMR
jgi:hypothetical protein